MFLTWIFQGVPTLKIIYYHGLVPLNFNFCCRCMHYPHIMTLYPVLLSLWYHCINLCALYILKICEVQVLEGGGAWNLAMQTYNQNSKYGELTRNLRETQLGGVIFGCKYDTIDECFKKQLFGSWSAPFTSFYKSLLCHTLVLLLQCPADIVEIIWSCSFIWRWKICFASEILTRLIWVLLNFLPL